MFEDAQTHFARLFQNFSLMYLFLIRTSLEKYRYVLKNEGVVGSADYPFVRVSAAGVNVDS
jgi:hypothetical protein